MKKTNFKILFILIVFILASCKKEEAITQNGTTLNGKTLDADSTLFETTKKVVGTLEDGLPDDGIPRFTTESKKQIDETVESEK